LYFGFPNNPKNLLWLAVYNLSSLNINKCKSLKGRNVYLFPDLSKEGKAFNLWSNKAQEIQQQLENSFFKVSDLLEELAPNQDKEQGKDIADYLIKLDWHKFRKKEIKNILEVVPQNTNVKNRIIAGKTNTINSKSSDNQFKEIQSKTTKIQREETFVLQEEQLIYWCEQIEELESFFNNIKLPKKTIKLNQCTTISNPNKFITSHLATVKANNASHIYLPYLVRLQELKVILKV
jgi:hypothetical protein